MRTKVLLLVFCGMAALGQTPTFVGLPQYGVLLTGAVDNPTIVNNSGKVLIGHVVHFEDANGSGNLIRTLDARRVWLNLPVPEVSTVFNGGGTQTRTSAGSPVKVVLDAAVFGDGQFVGPDKSESFDDLAARIDAQVALAKQVLTGR